MPPSLWLACLRVPPPALRATRRVRSTHVESRSNMRVHLCTSRRGWLPSGVPVIRDISDKLIMNEALNAKGQRPLTIQEVHGH